MAGCDTVKLCSDGFRKVATESHDRMHLGKRVDYIHVSYKLKGGGGGWALM